MSSPVGVTLVHRDARHRVVLLPNDLSYDALLAQAHACMRGQHTTAVAKARLYPWRRLSRSLTSPPSTWTLVYRDDEDDLVTVASEREFAEAARVFLDVLGPEEGEEKDLKTLPEMEFFIVATASLRLKDRLLPVLRLAEALAGRLSRLAWTTSQHVRQSAYVGRGRQSILVASRGLSKQLRRVAAVVGSLRRRPQQEEKPNKKRARSSFTKEKKAYEPVPQEVDVTKEAKDEQASATEGPAPIPLSAIPHRRPRSGSDTETESDAEEQDQSRAWDVVPEPTRLAAMEEENAIAMEGEHAEALRALRDVLPEVDLELCLELLNQHGFDVEATVMELMEE